MLKIMSEFSERLKPVTHCLVVSSTHKQAADFQAMNTTGLIPGVSNIELILSRLLQL